MLFCLFASGSFPYALRGTNLGTVDRARNRHRSGEEGTSEKWRERVCRGNRYRLIATVGVLLLEMEFLPVGKVAAMYEAWLGRDGWIGGQVELKGEAKRSEAGCR